MLAVHARAVGAKVDLEWPTRCIYWKIHAVVSFMRVFRLKKVNFDGCAVGLKSIARATRGMLIKKPLLMVTDLDEIVDTFKGLVCDGSHEHAPCQGIDTPNSENYNPEHAYALHSAHSKYCNSKHKGCEDELNINECILRPAQSTVHPSSSHIGVAHSE